MSSSIRPIPNLESMKISLNESNFSKWSRILKFNTAIAGIENYTFSNSDTTLTLSTPATSVLGGAGADTILTSTTNVVGATINGAGGNDTLNVNSGSLGTFSFNNATGDAKVSNVENLIIASTNNGATITADTSMSAITLTAIGTTTGDAATLTLADTASTTVTGSAASRMINVDATSVLDNNTLSVAGTSDFAVTNLAADIIKNTTGTVSATLKDPVGGLGATNNAAGTLTLDTTLMADGKTLNLYGNNNITVTGLIADLASTVNGGDLSITTGNAFNIYMDLGTNTSGTRTVNATAMADGNTLGLSFGNGALTLSTANVDVDASGYVGAITETLTTGAGVTSAVTLGSGVDLVTVTGVNATAVINLTTGASADEVFVGGTAPAAGSSYALNVGANIVHLAGGDLSNATISATGGTWSLDLNNTGALNWSTITTDQVNAVSGITDTQANNGLSINTSGGALTGYTLNTAVTNWEIGVTGNGNNSVTLGAVNQNVTFGSGADTLSVAGLTISGTVDFAAGSNILATGSGANIAQETITTSGGGTWALNLASGASDIVSASNLIGGTHGNAASGITGAGGTETVNVDTTDRALTGYTLSSNVEIWGVGTAGATRDNSVTLGAPGQVVTFGDGNDTLAIGGLTATAALKFENGTNILNVSTGANIVAATVTAGTGTWDLNVDSGASITVRTTDLAGSTAARSITGAAGVETVTVNTTVDGALTGYTLSSNINVWYVGTTGAGANSVTLGATGQNVTFGAGDDTLSVSTAAQLAGSRMTGGGGADALVLTTDGQTIVDTDFVNVSSFKSLTLANGVNSATLGADAFAAGITSVIGGTGANTLILGSQYQFAAVNLIGGASNDTFELTGTFTQMAASTITGGGGADVLELSNSVSLSETTPGDPAFAHVSSVETLTLLGMINAVNLNDAAGYTGFNTINLSGAGSTNQIYVNEGGHTIEIIGHGGIDNLSTTGSTDTVTFTYGDGTDVSPQTLEGNGIHTSLKLSGNNVTLTDAQLANVTYVNDLNLTSTTGSQTITLGTNVNHSGSNQLFQTISLGSGAATVTFDYAGPYQISNFSAGAADQVDFDVLLGTHLGTSFINGAGTPVNGTFVTNMQVIDSSHHSIDAVTNVLQLSGLFSDTTAVASALKTGGADELRFTNDPTLTHGAFAIAWLDLSSTVHYGVADIHSPLDVNLTSTNITVTNVVQLVGVSSTTGADFHFAG